MKKLFFFLPLLLLLVNTHAQTGFSFSCIRDTLIDCHSNCFTLTTTIPDIHAVTDSYTVNKVSLSNSCLRQLVDPAVAGGGAIGALDDIYTSVISLPFSFPFYGTTYNSLVASTNGYISFDVAVANQFSHYGILNNGAALSSIGGTAQDLPTTKYDRALIMAPYHDLDPTVATSPDWKIKYSVAGTAPYRVWILSFYRIPLYTNQCANLIYNTHQLLLYESTGMAEVIIYDKQSCTGWNQGRAMIGMQDYTRTKAIMAPGRAASSAPWGTPGMNECWRFVPAGGTSLFKRAELLDMNGTLVASGDTINNNNGTYKVSFPNVCTAVSSSYVVKTTYKKIDDNSAEIYGYDTINVTKQPGVNTSIQYPQHNYCKANGGTASPVITGVTGGRFSSAPGLQIDPISGDVNIALSDTGSYNILYQVPVDTCSNNGQFILRIVDNSRFVFSGAVNNTWEEAGNWACGQVPGSNSDVVIYEGTVIINSDVTINSLSVMPGASVTVQPGFHLMVLH